MNQPDNINISFDNVRMFLTWSSSFGTLQTARFSAAQAYIDKECVKYMTPLVPVALPKFRNAGKLLRSVKIVSAGRIYYLSEHSRYSYYIRSNHRHGGNPQAKRMWFEPMKRQYKGAILRGAAAIAGGRAK
ncbi:MAG: hypothetical protein J6Y71_07580 [Ruminococcus sp.]|nr:hypothetical protein [Ruminococcus sp.]